MNKLILFVTIIFSAAMLGSCGSSKKAIPARATMPLDTKVLLHTDSGDVVIRLYNETPLHRDNFVKLVRTGFYDSLLFHRVIPQFMIQGGDPDSKRAAAGNLLGDGGADMPRIQAEITPLYLHKRGVLAAARDDNPEKKSSASQFYIVTGRKFTLDELEKFGERSKRIFTEAEKNFYTTLGGAPWLDGKYTIFGEVESGMDVVEKIGNMARDVNNRPRTDIRMYIKIISPKKPLKGKR